MLFSPSDRPNTSHDDQARELASSLYNVQHFTGGNSFLPKSSNWARVALFISSYIDYVLNVDEHRLPGNGHADAEVWKLAREYAQKQALGFKDLESGKAEGGVRTRVQENPYDTPYLTTADPDRRLRDSLEAELDSLADEVQG